MKTINIALKGTIDFAAAERAAREAVYAKGEKVTLTAWTDRSRNMEGPSEACSGESWKCSHVYAEHHGADLRVSINDDEYEFFFTRVPEVFTELDSESVVDVHAHIAADSFNNLQGG